MRRFLLVWFVIFAMYSGLLEAQVKMTSGVLITGGVNFGAAVAPPPPPAGPTPLAYTSFFQTPLHTVWVAPSSASPAGNDSTCIKNDATHPCLTISKGLSLAVAGDIVRVKDGTYNISRIQISAGGSSGLPIQLVSDTRWGAHIVSSATSWAAVVATASYVDVIGFDITCTSTCDSGIEFQQNHSNARLNYIHDITPLQPAQSHVGGGGVHCYDAGSSVDCNAYDNLIVNFGTRLAGCDGTNGTADHGCATGQEDARWFYHAIYQETDGNVIGNLVVNSSGHCIQTYHNGATSNDIEHNTCINNWRSGILLSNSVANGNANSTVKYNVVVGPRLYCYDISNATTGTFDTNVAFHCPSGTVHNAGTSMTLLNWITTDPVFVNPVDTTFVGGGTAVGDYHLTSTSSAKDVATASTITNDLDLIPRPQGTVSDAGAYEFF